jgi:hypothetical protein
LERKKNFVFYILGIGIQAYDAKGEKANEDENMNCMHRYQIPASVMLWEGVLTGVP